MKKFLTGYLLLVVLNTFGQLKPDAGKPNNQHFLWAVNQLNNKQSKSVLVTAHRCDWRNAPENSIRALNNCVDMGVDMAEFDIAKTKDGQLVIMHDKTIDRTTTGTGKPGDYTFSEIAQFYLKNGTGHPTVHHIPTLDEMLNTAKGKILVDIDKGYEYYDDIVPLLVKKDMLNQAVLNIYGLPLDMVKAAHPQIPDNLILQLIIDPKNPDAQKIIDSYSSHQKTIIQIIFSNDADPIISKIPAIKNKYAVWFNSLWPEQNGGHDDDKAVEENKPDETWGWLVNHGANIIQSDRPKSLLAYLKMKKKHI
ncbi:glycerophosphodiester phosphodiesterase family protein [Mucilaginibacter paludis]|uniref:Glycerophosphoryl diester phosphodiesterase n=1 Tax=Mucilaginibacter paludis DSM 18603 TaxID=714943 RepID=H1Y5U3_9SPHI|nr:glycerophosphodiester phosphodiesterase family protein [Mucilaginibacter paludis]EHQ30365.1 glycerophosphoryl diester phosphodiesterase [Mucilaginibacter paludis DSM 18603]